MTRGHGNSKLFMFCHGLASVTVPRYVCGPFSEVLEVKQRAFIKDLRQSNNKFSPYISVCKTCERKKWVKKCHPGVVSLAFFRVCIFMIVSMPRLQISSNNLKFSYTEILGNIPNSGIYFGKS